MANRSKSIRVYWHHQYEQIREWLRNGLLEEGTHQDEMLNGEELNDQGPNGTYPLRAGE